MIFVTLGTQDKSFTRLLKVVEKAIEDGYITEQVVVQAGYTKYKSDKMEIFDSLPKDEFESYMADANLIITHGGVGNILTALEQGKTVIAVPRLARYKEHTNDHQKQIVREFTKMGYILSLTDFSRFHQVLTKAKTFKPKPYLPHREAFQKVITNYIEKDYHISWYNRDKEFLLSLLVNLALLIFLPFFDLQAVAIVTVSFLVSTFLFSFFKPNGKYVGFFILLVLYLLNLGMLSSWITKINMMFVFVEVGFSFLTLLCYHFIEKRRG